MPWILLGVIGWGYVLILGASMLATEPPTAGFDLALLTEAARRIGAGASPYDPELVGGAPVAAPSLFYSYPPPVAQATAAPIASNATGIKTGRIKKQVKRGFGGLG